MKIVITSVENNINSAFDLRFGRAGYFCVYDTSSKETEFILNEHNDANSGAGIKAAEKVIELGVTRVISGDFGPKAKDLLNQFKIQMVMLDDNAQTINTIIGQIK